MKTKQITHATEAHEIISSREFKNTNDCELLNNAIEVTWFLLCKVNDALKRPHYIGYSITVYAEEYPLFRAMFDDVKMSQLIITTMEDDHGYFVSCCVASHLTFCAIVSWEDPKPISVWRDFWYCITGQWVHDKAWVAKRLKKVWNKQKKEMMK